MCRRLIAVVVVLFVHCFDISSATETENELLLLTVATSATDGFQRYLRSTQIYNLNGKVLGMGEEWPGGSIANKPGGGFKVNLLKDEMEKHKEDEQLIVLFSDSYDVVLSGDASEIVAAFKAMDARIVFGAEETCWPDRQLAKEYPEPDGGGYRFLNSGGFIGYAKDVYDMLTAEDITDLDDDQRFYTKRFLAERDERKIKLDHKTRIFCNLNHAISDFELRFSGSEPRLFNTQFETRPLLIHGNGPSKRHLNHLGNYIPKAWNEVDQCTACWEDNLDLDKMPETPQVAVGLFIARPTPFLEECFAKIFALDYPKSKMDLLIHVAVDYHSKDVEAFVAEAKEYNSVAILGPEDALSEEEARTRGFELCAATKCDYYLSVDSVAHLDNPKALRLMVEQNRGVLAPLLLRPGKAWSNFWGALGSDGFYARSSDYMEIVQFTRTGVWNVPYISSCYLLHGSLLHDADTRPSFVADGLDADMALCHNLREADVFLHVTNREAFGHLINAEDFSTEHLHNDMYEIVNNKEDWERRYLHANYSQNLEEGREHAQPCPDVFWFPIMSDRFADELVAEMENHGKWSDGTNKDARLDSGYENVPTRDIHMKQIGMDDEWLELLRAYVKPLVERVFDGYENDPPHSIMNFVVRYRPDEQPFLRPHHDSSTYTINIALNRVDIDYEGGGCKFIRYDCAVSATRKGWMMMHPGRLTHYHEGLETTKGTRYIMISFVDP
jgi:procollagen-lysine,2-oxoglutarate 5-dioxygenase